MFVTLRDYVKLAPGLADVGYGQLATWRKYSTEAKNFALARNPARAQSALNYVTSVYNGWSSADQEAYRGEYEYTRGVVQGDAGAVGSARAYEAERSTIYGNAEGAGAEAGRRFDAARGVWYDPRVAFDPEFSPLPRGVKFVTDSVKGVSDAVAGYNTTVKLVAGAAIVGGLVLYGGPLMKAIGLKKNKKRRRR